MLEKTSPSSGSTEPDPSERSEGNLKPKIMTTMTITNSVGRVALPDGFARHPYPQVLNCPVIGISMMVCKSQKHG
jgi:hypothetical protein